MAPNCNGNVQVLLLSKGSPRATAVCKHSDIKAALNSHCNA